MHDFYNNAAYTLVVRTRPYLGKNYSAVQEALRKPIPGSGAEAVSTMERLGLIEKTPEELGDFHHRCNVNTLAEAVSTLMQKRPLGQAEEEALIHFYPLLKLPRNLRGYVNYVLATLDFYGDPAAAIENFPDLYFPTVLPVFRERLEKFGVSVNDIARALKGDRELDPFYVLWFLSGIVPPFERVDGAVRFSPHALRFANAILGQNVNVLNYGPREAGEIDNRALRALLDCDSLPTRDALFESDNVLFNTPSYLIYTDTLPVKVNGEFDADRLQAVIEMYKKDDQRNGKDYAYQESKNANKHHVIIHRLENGKVTGTFDSFSTISAKHYSESRTETDGRPESASWDDISQFLKEKFEAGGYTHFSQIAAHLNDRPEQIELLKQPILTIRQHTEPDHFITSSTVANALLHPEKARYANGMAINLLHDKLREFIDPDVDIDEFYGLKKTEPETLEQIAVGAIWQQIDRMTREDPLLRNAFTEQQRATLIGLHGNDITEFLENPDQVHKRKYLHTIEVLSKRFEISFTAEESREISRERQRIAGEARRAAADAIEQARQARLRQRREREQTHNVQSQPSPARPPAPWLDIPASVAELCKRKGFENFDAVVGAIQQDFATTIQATGTTGQPRGLNRQVRLALQNLADGFLHLPNDERPMTLMHAHLETVLDLSRNDLQSLRQVRMNAEQNGGAHKSLIQANIITSMREKPHLCHLTGWQQFADEFKGADVMALTGDLANAYRLLNPRDLRISANGSLPVIVDVINRGGTTAPIRPQDIVSPTMWLTAYRAKNGKRCIIAVSVVGEQLTVG